LGLRERLKEVPLKYYSPDIGDLGLSGFSLIWSGTSIDLFQKLILLRFLRGFCRRGVEARR
jgi:hypothetical protein